MSLLYPTDLDSSSIRLLRPVPTDDVSISASPTGADHCPTPLLRFALETYRIRDAPPYTAFSYTWGPPEDGMADYVDRDKRLVIINGAEFQVFPNLWDALHSLLSPARPESSVEAPGFFWIDAICIDQSNLREREAQVSIMDVIYKRASNTLIWLGAVCDDTPGAMKIIDLVNSIPTEQYLELRREARGRAFSKVESEQIMQRFGLPSCMGPNAWVPWAPAFRFFRRRWFHRTWTIQEVVLSDRPIVRCGHLERPWEAISRTAIFLDRITSVYSLQADYIRATEPDFDRARNHWNFMRRVTITTMKAGSSRLEDYAGSLGPRLTGAQEAGAASILLQEALTHRMSHATDKRDRVYGLLGIANHITELIGVPKSDLRPNYGESSTAASVFETVMKDALLEAKCLRLLIHLNDQRPNRLEGLPSWVIDFSSTHENGHPIGYIRPAFNAAARPTALIHNTAERPMEAKFVVSDHKLYVKGVVVARVGRTIISRYGQSDPNIQHLPFWMASLAETSTLYPFSKESRAEAFWRTLIMNVNPELGHPAEWQGMQPGQMFNSWLARLIYDWTTKTRRSIAEIREMQRIVELLAPDHRVGHMPLCGWTCGNEAAADNTMDELCPPDTAYVFDFDLSDKEPDCPNPPRARFWFSITANAASEHDTADTPMSVPFDARPGTPPRESIESRYHQFSYCVDRAFARRKLVLSDEYHFGLVPKAGEEGDHIAVVDGCPWPLVIREQRDGYLVIGSAYIHGIMHGEAVGEATPWQKIAFI